MKNWYKTFEFDERDVLVMKEFDDLENKFLISIIFHHDQIRMTQNMGYSTAAKRDARFNHFTKENALVISSQIIKSYKKITA